MRLRKISVLAILAISSAILAGNLVISSFVVNRGFFQLEEEYARNSAAMARQNILEKLNVLDSFVWDWASWNDTYSFAREPYDEYIDSNLPVDTFLEQALCAVIIRNQNNDVLYARAVDPEGGDDPALLGLILEKTLHDLPLIAQDSGQGGLAVFSGEIVLLAKRPILMSDSSGPAAGSLVMARPVTSGMLDDLARNLGYPVAMEAPDESLVEALLGSEDRISVDFADKDTAFARALLLDVDLKPAAVLRVAVERRITRQGEHVSRYNRTFVAAVICCFTVLVYFLLHRTFLKRLEKLDRDVSGIQRSGNPEQRVAVDGNDEISDLGANVNSLLDTVDSSRRETEAKSLELQANERFLNQVINSMSVGILLVDPENKTILDINDSALAMTGFSREEVLGKVCHKLVCPSDVGSCPILDRGQFQDLSKRKLLRKDGSILPIMKSVSFVDRQGQNLLLETIFDISEMERARLELETIKEGLELAVLERTRDIEQANEKLIALDKAKTLFLSSASHELRTPLTSIIGFIKILEKNFSKRFLPHLEAVENLGPRAVQFMGNLDVVRIEAERLGRLVNDLLDLNKIESGRMEWRDRVLKVDDVLTNAAEAFSGHAAEHANIRFNLTLPDNPLGIRADGDRIHQVLINLLSNAFKYTEQGMVELSARARDGLIEFWVCDTGKGVPEEDREKIFELFYQVQDENLRSSNVFGTGLGLAICRQIAVHYKGDITAHPHKSGGTCFLFTIPSL